MSPSTSSISSHKSPRFLLYPHEEGYLLQRDGGKGQTKFINVPAAIAYLHSTPGNIGATLVVFNDRRKPSMNIVISHRLLAAVDEAPILSIDYDEDRKSFILQGKGGASPQAFPSIKAAIAQLAATAPGGTRLTFRDAAGKAMFFATLPKVDD